MSAPSEQPKVQRALLTALAWAVSWWRERNRRLLLLLLDESAPVDLRLVGRTLMHAALVGMMAGVVSAGFFWLLEHSQSLVLEQLVGYVPLRASGEHITSVAESTEFRPWLLTLVLVLGGLGCGVVMRFAPEVRGGGADEAIDAFHRHGGAVRLRVLVAKPLASLFTLGSGGAGGREGPTMLLGAAIGSATARLLAVTPRERRILLVAGMAAGMSAMFRTPLGAALLAVEVLYRDGFEQDALVPAILASVVSYSVDISIFGESTLFEHAPRFPFIPGHLPYYGLLALSVAFLGHLFIRTLGAVRALSAGSRLPEWLRPAAGALVLGITLAPVLAFVGSRLRSPGHGFGILGSGYGVVQAAISGAPWLSTGWQAVAVLGVLLVAKLLASALTIGTGGSAGDFAPSLVIGGLFGSAFGRAVGLISGDPRIDAGAFALVGMGAFYGGVAHVPLSALVLVCEMAGNYDLLVPLMLALGIVFVGMRRSGIYHAQVALSRTPHAATAWAALDTTSIESLVTRREPAVSFERSTPAVRMLEQLGETLWQDVFPVHDADGALCGMVTADALRILASDRHGADIIVAADVMQVAVTIQAHESVRVAAQRLAQFQVRELLVVDGAGKVVGFLDETRLTTLLLNAAARATDSQPPAA